MVIQFLALTIILTPSSCTSSSVVMRADRLLHLQGQYCLPPSPHSCYLELLEACFSSYNIPSSISMHDAPSVASIIPHLYHDLSSERAADTRLHLLHPLIGFSSPLVKPRPHYKLPLSLFIISASTVRAKSGEFLSDSLIREVYSLFKYCVYDI